MRKILLTTPPHAHSDIKVSIPPVHLSFVYWYCDKWINSYDTPPEADTVYCWAEIIECAHCGSVEEACYWDKEGEPPCH